LRAQRTLSPPRDRRGNARAPQASGSTEPLQEVRTVPEETVVVGGRRVLTMRLSMRSSSATRAPRGSTALHHPWGGHLHLGGVPGTVSMGGAVGTGGTAGGRMGRGGAGISNEKTREARTRKSRAPRTRPLLSGQMKPRTAFAPRKPHTPNPAPHPKPSTLQPEP